MYKNRSLFFLIIFKIVALNTFLHAMEFNPEAYEFSQKKTIESWIAPEFNKVYRSKEESEICTGYTDFLNTVKINGQLCRKLDQVNIANHFTPTIYTNAFQLAADQLEIKIQKIDGYFMDQVGNTYITFNNNKKILFASIIISKLEQS